MSQANENFEKFERELNELYPNGNVTFEEDTKSIIEKTEGEIVSIASAYSPWSSPTYWGDVLKYSVSSEKCILSPTLKFLPLSDETIKYYKELKEAYENNKKIHIKIEKILRTYCSDPLLVTNSSYIVDSEIQGTLEIENGSKYRFSGAERPGAFGLEQPILYLEKISN
ncbi:MAG: hypothetical protein QMD14_04880 [Candidatus Aenigmarchaeota archaeon]|nr:hypothetical protein [Candidatus Aenigmarchaeota archaeon]